MNFKYNRIKENSDATTSYNIEGDFPVRFEDLFDYILKNDESFIIEFGCDSEKFNGWLGNRLEIHRRNGQWYMYKQKPDTWFKTIKNLNVIKCWANGGYGQMIYIVTFDEGTM